MQLHSSITAATTKVESYHGFSKWFFFRGEGIIAHHDPEEQERIIKYNDLIVNVVIFHNVIDLTKILCGLKREGYVSHFARISASPLTGISMSSVKRYRKQIEKASTQMSRSS